MRREGGDAFDIFRVSGFFRVVIRCKVDTDGVNSTIRTDDGVRWNVSPDPRHLVRSAGDNRPF